MLLMIMIHCFLSVNYIYIFLIGNKMIKEKQKKRDNFLLRDKLSGILLQRYEHRLIRKVHEEIRIFSSQKIQISDFHTCFSIISHVSSLQHSYSTLSTKNCFSLKTWGNNVLHVHSQENFLPISVLLTPIPL